VTGSSQGIGRATAFAFAEEGAEVVLFDINARKIEETSHDISFSTRRRTLALHGDVGKKADVERMVKTTIDEFGRIDILTNNAGIWRGSLLAEMEEEDWDAIFDVNVKGVFLCSQLVAQEMIKRKSGRIINIASAAGKGSGVASWGAYCASKAAVIMLTKVLAKELRPFGITANALCPGATDTALLKNIISTQGGDYRHAARPGDVARAVIFLSSDLAEGVTGKIFDGPPQINIETLRKILEGHKSAYDG